MGLTIAALLPAAFLVAYIYKKDKIEKEPWPLIFKLLFLGAIAAIPAAFSEIFLEGLLSSFFLPESLLYKAIANFLIVALMEEFFKRLAVITTTWRHPDFNYRFDAVVYAVSASMGFAALENVLYVMDGGFSLAVSRALLAVPSHAVDAVFMGCFLGEAKLCEFSGDLQGKKRNLFLSLCIPVLTHGFYDFCLDVGTIGSMLFFLLFVAAMDILAVVCVNQSARKDTRVRTFGWRI